MGKGRKCLKLLIHIARLQLQLSAGFSWARNSWAVEGPAASTTNTFHRLRLLRRRPTLIFFLPPLSPGGPIFSRSLLKPKSKPSHHSIRIPLNGKVVEEEEEEVSKTRLLVQNVPWTRFDPCLRIIVLLLMLRWVSASVYSLSNSSLGFTF
ncbi:UNVERIFIED_CONTAM: hypothetical protein Sangu_1907200 [Sesamum angustifolium]|uniref:Uncharacterized protein n=1 Tax=Sesamum angustifolium TaxID=2727405 RepID=A0AAW2LUK5_9LAMI